MDAKPVVLIASRSKPALAELLAKLGNETRYDLRSRHVENGHADPLWGLSFVPDVIVMALNERGHHDLAEITQQAAAQRPPTIVLAEQGDAQTMRLAMQAGARDFLPGALNLEELIASIDRAVAHAVKRPDGASSTMIAVVNAKGGSGATFIATNLAYVLKTISKHSTALMSLDMQFESLMQHFDLKLKHGLMEVLENAHTLDAVSLDAYMTQHESALRLLAARPEDSPHRNTDRSRQLGTLLDRMGEQYERVIVDMPRRVDPYTECVLERADRLVLVVQQTVSHLRDAARMLQICGHYGLKNDQTLVVVNRFEKSSPVGMEDVRRAMGEVQVVSIPSDFKIVSESINLGVALHAHARSSAVAKAIGTLADNFGERAPKVSGSLLGKAFSSLLRKQTWSPT
ncbi:MAG TPA: AAA family ATPase [Gammaproteobacteria bacterium]|nr:AAA family ATPase [Gammaproteobacteria bacterium]